MMRCRSAVALTGVALLSSTLGANTATAQFIGIDLREDKSPASAEGLPSFPGADNVRVFNLYAMFAGPGGGSPATGDFTNTVVGVLQPSPNPDDVLQEGFGLNIDRNPDATFYRSPAAAGGSTVGGYDIKTPGDSRREWNTYVSIGLKTFDSKSGPFAFDITHSDPNFGFHTNEKRWGDRDLDHLPPLQRSDWMSGSWQATVGGVMQGAARDLGDGTYGVFLAQLSAMNLEVGSELGSGGVAEMSSTQMISTEAIWEGDVFSGAFLLTTADDRGVHTHEIRFIVPGPGALALFTLTGAHFARRRR